ncbi:MAG: O-acetylserine/cysteine efflux transporter [Saprospiraceae bacterium]|jgi:O-acetylserine/cysteine efflux transporter
MSLIHQLTAMLVAFVWGTNFVLIKLGLADLPPFLFATLRFTLVAVPLVFILKRPPVPWKYLMAYGVLIGFGQFGLLFWSMQGHITPGLASLVIQIQVFFTILLAFWVFKEQLKLMQVGALLIGAMGLVIIMIYTDGETSSIGLMVVLLAALSWAAANIVVKQVGRVDILGFIAWSSLFAIPPLLLMSLYYEGPQAIANGLIDARWDTWLIVLWQTVGNTLIGYGLWNKLLEQYDAALVTPWALLVPVFGLAASSWWLNEPLYWWKWLAAALILSGLVINLLASKKPRSN